MSTPWRRSFRFWWLSGFGINPGLVSCSFPETRGDAVARAETSGPVPRYPMNPTPDVTPMEANRRLAAQEIESGLVEVRSVPHEIQFSPELRCNLRCVMCWSTVARKQGLVLLSDRELRDLTLARLRKLEPWIDRWQHFALSGNGEPLINPALPEILDLLGGHSVQTSLTTNASLLDRELSEKLVESGLHEVTISVDAACARTYERIRVGGKWKTLLRAIDGLVRAKRDLSSETPQIQLAGNFMRQNIEELPGLVDLAAAHGAQRVFANCTMIFDPAMEEEALVRYPELARKMVDEAELRARRAGIELVNRILVTPAEPEAAEALEAPEVTDPDALAEESAPDSSPEPPTPPPAGILQLCQKPWTGLMVWSDGSVRVCCYSEIELGNLNAQSPPEIWNGPMAQWLRRSFLENRPPQGCRSCPVLVHTGWRDELFVQVCAGVDFALDHPPADGVLEPSTVVRGWALHAEGIAKVELLLDGEKVGETGCDQPRPDVAEAYPRHSDHLLSGFSCALDTSAWSPGRHLLSLLITAGDGRSDEVAHRMVEVPDPVDPGAES